MECVPQELNKAGHDKITKHCKMGDSFAEQERYEDAFNEYNKAWEILPEPKGDWETSTWILAAIADIYF